MLFVHAVSMKMLLIQLWKDSCCRPAGKLQPHAEPDQLFVSQAQGWEVLKSHQVQPVANVQSLCSAAIQPRLQWLQWKKVCSLSWLLIWLLPSRDKFIHDNYLFVCFKCGLKFSFFSEYPFTVANSNFCDCRTQVKYFPMIKSYRFKEYSCESREISLLAS